MSIARCKRSTCVRLCEVVSASRGPQAGTRVVEFTNRDCRRRYVRHPPDLLSSADGTNCGLCIPHVLNRTLDEAKIHPLFQMFPPSKPHHKTPSNFHQTSIKPSPFGSPPAHTARLPLSNYSTVVVDFDYSIRSEEDKS